MNGRNEHVYYGRRGHIVLNCIEATTTKMYAVAKLYKSVNRETEKCRMAGKNGELHRINKHFNEFK